MKIGISTIIATQIFLEKFPVEGSQQERADLTTDKDQIRRLLRAFRKTTSYKKVKSYLIKEFSRKNGNFALLELQLEESPTLLNSILFIFCWLEMKIPSKKRNEITCYSI